MLPLVSELEINSDPVQMRAHPQWAFIPEQIWQDWYTEGLSLYIMQQISKSAIMSWLSVFISKNHNLSIKKNSVNEINTNKVCFIWIRHGSWPPSNFCFMVWYSDFVKIIPNDYLKDFLNLRELVKILLYVFDRACYSNNLKHLSK